MNKKNNRINEKKLYKYDLVLKLYDAMTQASSCKIVGRKNARTSK